MGRNLAAILLFRTPVVLSPTNSYFSSYPNNRIFGLNFHIMSLYSIFLHLHSAFRFVVMVLVVLAILQSFVGWFGNRLYTETNRKINLFAFISAHTQLLLGIILYFLSPFVKFNSDTMKDDTTRYWTVEHASMMAFAIALITVGYIRSKKILLPAGKHRAIAIFYSLALLVIVVAIIQSLRPFFGIS
jgi:hypothetical protein